MFLAGRHSTSANFKSLLPTCEERRSYDAPMNYNGLAYVYLRAAFIFIAFPNTISFLSYVYLWLAITFCVTPCCWRL